MDEDKYDEAWTTGNQAAYRSILSECVRNLPDCKEEKRLIERTDTISMLRTICEEHGDNDWDDDLYIPDILEKHLFRYLEVGDK